MLLRLAAEAARRGHAPQEKVEGCGDFTPLIAAVLLGTLGVIDIMMHLWECSLFGANSYSISFTMQFGYPITRTRTAACQLVPRLPHERRTHSRIIARRDPDRRRYDFQAPPRQPSRPYKSYRHSIKLKGKHQNSLWL